MSDWFSVVEKIAEDVCQSLGCLLYDLDFSGTGQGRTLRVFIDREGGAGAGIEDCSNVSRSLSEKLDAQEELIPGGAYQLEVSTPGIDRILKKAWHFEKVVGKKIWIKTAVPFGELGVSEPSLEKTKQMEAVLKFFGSDRLTLENKKGDVSLPLSGIEKAKVVFEMPKKIK
jgi:ribosome maturation factor RimP